MKHTLSQLTKVAQDNGFANIGEASKAGYTLEVLTSLITADSPQPFNGVSTPEVRWEDVAAVDLVEEYVGTQGKYKGEKCRNFVPGTLEFIEGSSEKGGAVVGLNWYDNKTVRYGTFYRTSEGNYRLNGGSMRAGRNVLEVMLAYAENHIPRSGDVVNAPQRKTPAQTPRVRSSQAAVQAAQAAPEQVTTPDLSDLDTLTKGKLLERADQLGVEIKYRNTTNKPEIAQKIRDHFAKLQA